MSKPRDNRTVVHFPQPVLEDMPAQTMCGRTDGWNRGAMLSRAPAMVPYEGFVETTEVRACSRCAKAAPGLIASWPKRKARMEAIRARKAREALVTTR